MPGKVINSLCNQACCFRCYLYGHLYADLCFKGQVTLYLVLYSVVSTAHISQQKIPKVPLKIFSSPIISCVCFLKPTHQVSSHYKSFIKLLLICVQSSGKTDRYYWHFPFSLFLVVLSSSFVN